VGADLRGAALLSGNTAPILSGSTIAGALACSGTMPVDLGVPNTVKGGGACADLADGSRGRAYEAVEHPGQ
jgi:hypothetical protein